MKTKANIKSTAMKSCWLLIALCVLSPAALSAADKAPKRHALVYMSDGTQYEGIVQLTPGVDFRMTKLPGDDTATTVDVENIRAKTKVFTFNFNVVKEMTFSPNSEEYLKKYKILNISNMAAGIEKVRFGAPYPVLKPKCTVLFNSGEAATGIVDTRVMYLKVLEPDTGFVTGTKKFVMRSKYSGEPGQSLDDLVHVKRIKMLDEGDEIARSMEVDFRSFKFGSADADNGVRALTRDTLSKVVVRKDAGDGKIRVHSTLGENVFLAAQINGKWVAGWPAEGTKRTDLFKSVETEVLKVQDYYTEKKMLGIISEDRDRKITVLVRLRRDIPDPEFALAWAKGVGGGFEMDKNGELMEFYRLSIWRFVRDNETGKMTLMDRGTFCRTRIKLEEETPEMGIAPALWPVVLKDGKLIVGSNE
ncbi:MAG: hypothetical protein QGG71_23795 [Pirellulaceae bacterium]|nr:hypothetical protein [Pirellulaceae bacterium]